MLTRDQVRVGSVLLLPELLSKPWHRVQTTPTSFALVALLALLDLQPFDIVFRADLPEP